MTNLRKRENKWIKYRLKTAIGETNLRKRENKMD